MKDQRIEHQGRIVAIKDLNVTVRILALSACATCDAKHACGTSEKKEKFIEVRLPNKNHSFSVGEEVDVSVSKKMGVKAVIIGFVLPLIVLVAIVIASLKNGLSDAAAAIFSLVSLCIYYFLLYKLRHKIDRQFTFQIEHRPSSFRSLRTG